MQLTDLGYHIQKGRYPSKYEQVYFVHISSIFSCSVTINHQLKNSCKTGAQEGLHMQLARPKHSFCTYIVTARETDIFVPTDHEILFHSLQCDTISLTGLKTNKRFHLLYIYFWNSLLKSKPWNFNILNFNLFTNEFLITYKFKYNQPYIARLFLSFFWDVVNLISIDLYQYPHKIVEQ